MVTTKRGECCKLLSDRRRLLGPYGGTDGATVDGTFVVLKGDNVSGESVSPVIERATESEVDAALTVEEVSYLEATEIGVVKCIGNRITSLVEKPNDPPSTLASTGCYVLLQTVFQPFDCSSHPSVASMN